MSLTQRIVVSSLSLSAAAFISLAGYEAYTGEAIIPTKGDVPTVGLGSTSYEDGSRVKMGDKITPVRAIRLAGAHIAKEEKIFRDSLPGVALHQAEYDIYMDFIYQYGTGAWIKSSMRSNLLAGRYVAACDSLLKYRFSAGYDCSTPGNKRCYGVWTRQQERHAACMLVQEGL